MKKILMITLDERPCNFDFPSMMPKADYEIIKPPKELMGEKKKAADTDKLANWTLEKAKDADFAVISMDTIIYGGIVPSRLHHETEEVLLKRADILKSIREINKNIKIFAFQLIMRCPWYSLSDEEPDYYDLWGREIHRLGRYKHLEQLNLMTKEDVLDKEDIMSRIDKSALNDFTDRRKTNLNVLMYTLNYVKSGIIDFFIVPQDDAAVYGFTSLDQIKVRSFIKSNSLHTKISMYPSADDTGMTLLARAVNAQHNIQPKIYVGYASSKGGAVIPSFEDRIIDETIKFQIISAGCQRVYSMTECDIFLAVNIGSSMLNSDETGYVTAYDIERNLAEFITQIKYARSLKKTVGVADVAHANGGDEEFVNLLSVEGLLFEINAYAGWNTSSNTIGTVICQSVLYLTGKDVEGNKTFLLHRYLEDLGYCTHTRKYITENNLPSMGLNYFNSGGKTGKVSELVKGELLNYFAENYPEIAAHIQELTVQMPWARMFEVDIKVKAKGF